MLSDLKPNTLILNRVAGIISWQLKYDFSSVMENKRARIVIFGELLDMNFLKPSQRSTEVTVTTIEIIKTILVHDPD